ncbi:(Dimethylallyl)adenosine tRNA methylthiotransferase MiaB [Sedimentisphaera cyanobacteriorum]|uniref:tRNA-2-methylthio-N(6)-dimethylallyladenosine synthase n=1 Tax=Sedimentisphaera cyanobacteriorum TaxID=1940790 RepID=A0A1Q2HSS5_9BACT|nr:tRNA (N6-isopentenyl adenosine(37)-C2)-methylthiotransferase MiaB [Sedimentisphaera cyanobacteriorum]AQQ10381.1 (Dimethylallyl)adenosine tRNA methylthiotransferase MiaB [Sedimentisphaera cyanobacteriorum]
MNKNKLYIVSFGCQMNKLDTSLVEAEFTKEGFELTNNQNEADVILMNTCSVREHAEQRVLSRLGYAKHLKRSGRKVVVGVIGCMAQRLGSSLLERDEVDIVCGPGQIPELKAMVLKKLEDRKGGILNVSAHIRKSPSPQNSNMLDEFELENSPNLTEHKNKAFVRVMRGCNNFCSYCIVPFVRGPEISRSPEKILQQIRRLADSGVRQITLLGQTVNSYRHKENGTEYRLHNLLEKTAEIDGIEWISFVTNYPYMDYTAPLFKAVADIDKVCPYLHLPAQSGSERILKAMNRKYSAEDYIRLIDEAREYVPDIAVAGDFIVGFPGETDEDFRDTEKLVERIRYKNIFAFKYSPRPGTSTEKRLEDNVPDKVKRERNIKLLALQESISSEDNKKFEGEVFRVFVEGKSSKGHLNSAENQIHPQLIGRTAGDYIVVFNGPEELAGKFADVSIEKTSALTLFGTLLERRS